MINKDCILIRCGNCKDEYLEEIPFDIGFDSYCEKCNTYCVEEAVKIVPSSNWCPLSEHNRQIAELKAEVSKAIERIKQSALIEYLTFKQEKELLDCFKELKL